MPKRIIQFTQLGKFGRFGNQIFQYLFARAYAERNNAVLEIPSWVGQKIFKNVDHPTPSVSLPSTKLDEIPDGGKINISLHGYCQKQEFIDYLSKVKIREWLQFQDKWLEFFGNLTTPAVAHLRRGDYLTKYSNIFCVVSKKSYEDAIVKFDIPKISLVWRSEESQIRWRGLSDDLLFLPDFFEMIQCQYLLRANSTFSFWAGFFNKGKVYSPIVEGQLGKCDVEFVEGNHPKIYGGNPDFIFKD